MNGGKLIADVLASQGVRFLFTLVGGHISPILSESKKAGIRVIDVRHEVNAVFAADAVARLSGVPGVAAVTAGPGVTNTLTAIKNAAMAQSPLVLLGGAAATVLKGRGSLQDIDQMALMKPQVKWAACIRKLSEIRPVLEKAFAVAQEGVPGPVFVECPIDVLYEEELVRDWYGAAGNSSKSRSLGDKFLSWYLKRHVDRIFKGMRPALKSAEKLEAHFPLHKASTLSKVANRIRSAKRPVMLIGSQTLLQTAKVDEIAMAIETIGIPVYLSGMARGLLGENHPLQLRHKRRNALKEADLVLLSGVPCDFRLDYGRHIRRSATYISVNRSREDLFLNRRPNIAVHADPGNFLLDLAKSIHLEGELAEWKSQLHERDEARIVEIITQSAEEVQSINPLMLFRELDPMLDPNAILVADGGDFVATAAYILNPRGPLSWLDPGAFGTLGVGAGFALGAKLVRPDSEVWIIWGDGSAAYSLAEFDTFVRHNVPVIGLIGNDACWSQIARDQVVILKDDVACMLSHSDYELVAKGYGGEGVRVDTLEGFIEAAKKAKQAVAEGRPFLINAIIGKTEFRKGSISI
jgi:thiamine pyrophosphate-dependent acetolactate synthase large subunit-like protein